jgi:hypothetical protein
MTFENLVLFFQEWSGREDLDNEIIVEYLNSGQRFLDDLSEFQKGESRYLYLSSVGQSFLSLVAQAKLITSVVITESNESFNVIEVPLAELRILDRQLPAYRAQGRPEYFSLADVRKVSSAMIPLTYQGNMGLQESGTSADKLGILFSCPADKAYLVDITGKFYSATIEEDIDPDTFWAVSYPFTLIHAALYKLEISYRNSEGAKDWLNSIMADLKTIDFNKAEQSAYSISEMGG